MKDLLSLLDHLEINQATLIGHSMGGQIATEFALNYPERVSKLVLLAPGLSGFSYSKEFEKNMKTIHELPPISIGFWRVIWHGQKYISEIKILEKDIDVLLVCLVE
ncbi:MULTISPECIES: alpha/beta fold hydrolase [unclassified Peribacillus]|nr:MULTISPECIES: alpha/beta hydrolase [unclassified Peribacillus]